MYIQSINLYYRTPKATIKQKHVIYQLEAINDKYRKIPRNIAYTNLKQHITTSQRRRTLHIHRENNTARSLCIISVRAVSTFPTGAAIWTRIREPAACASYFWVSLPQHQRRHCLTTANTPLRSDLLQLACYPQQITQCKQGVPQAAAVAAICCGVADSAAAKLQTARQSSRCKISTCQHSKASQSVHDENKRVAVSTTSARRATAPRAQTVRLSVRLFVTFVNVGQLSAVCNTATLPHSTQFDQVNCITCIIVAYAAVLREHNCIK